MDLTGEERGQSIQIGAVILFGALIILLSTYQAFVIPDQNREVEFKHSQSVQNDMKELRSDIISVASSGGESSVSVQLGTEYPSRAIFLNPGPPSGSLRTVGTSNTSINISVANATATGEVGDFWNGTTRNYSTGALVYQPNYNEYQNPPTTVYSNSVLYNQFGDGNLTLTDQSLISGRSINLIALNGSVSGGQSGSTSVDVRATSASATRVPVTNQSTGENVTIKLPTRLSESKWEELLQAQRTGDGHVQNVTVREQSGTFDQLVVKMEPDVTYNLKLSRVGVGSNIDTTTPGTYLIKRQGQNAVVPEGQNVTLAVQARDTYNNPSSGESVQANTSRNSLSGDGKSSVTVDGESDSDGIVELVYSPPEDVDQSQNDRINVSLNTTAGDLQSSVNSSTPENVSFSVTISDSDGSGIDSNGSSVGSYEVNWQDPNGTAGIENCDSSECTFNYEMANALNLTMQTDPIADGATVDYAVGSQKIGTVNPKEGTTNSSGQNATTFTPCNNGAVNVYTSSGADGDKVKINVTNYGSLVINPDTENVNSTHEWQFDDVCFEGEVDNITVDYPSSASFDGLNQDNITVEITRQGDSSPTEIDVNNAVYSGDSATFDLSGNFNTDIDGLVTVEIDGIENPTAGNQKADLTFNGSEDEVNFEKSFTTVVPDPQGTVNVEDTITADQSDFTVGYTFDFTANDNATLVVENEETGGSTTETITADGSSTIAASDVGGLNDGDTVRATLYEFANESNELATDTSVVEEAGFSSVGATSILPSTTGQNQSFTFSPQTTAIPDQTTISINVTDAQHTSPSRVDYQGNAGANISASGDVNTENGNKFINITTGEEIATGETVRVWTSGVNTGPASNQDPSYSVNITREDTGGTATATFEVNRNNGESRLRNLKVSDLTPNTDDQPQTIVFEPTTRLPAKEVVSIDLSEAQNTGTDVDYNNPGSIDANVTTSVLQFRDRTSENASIQFKAQDAISANTAVEINISEVDTSGMNNAGYEIGFSRGDADTASTMFGTKTPPNFTVTIDSTNTPVIEGEDLLVNATIENAGETEGTQDVTLDVGGNERDSTQLTIAGGETETVNLTWATTNGDAGSNIQINVSSQDDFDTNQVTVTNGPLLYNGDMTAVNDGDDAATDAIEFTMENIGSSDITITEVIVDSADSATTISQPSNNCNNAGGRFDAGLWVVADSQNGCVADNNDYEIGVDPFNLGQGNNQEAILTSSETDATFTIHEFRDSNGNSVSMSGANVVVTITYESAGTEYTLTIDDTA